MMSNIMLPFNYMKLANVIYIKQVLTRFKDSYKIYMTYNLFTTYMKSLMLMPWTLLMFYSGYVWGVFI